MTVTLETFLVIYPQFRHVPQPALEMFFDSASKLPEQVWLDRYAEGVMLYTAHKCVMYLRTLPDVEGMDEAQARQAVISAGTSKGVVSSKAVGDVSVSMSESANAAQNAAQWGDLTETEFGLQFIGLAKVVSVGGMYVV